LGDDLERARPNLDFISTELCGKELAYSYFRNPSSI
jgi:hypothetical protein